MAKITESKTHRKSRDIERFWAKLSSGELAGHYYIALLGLKTFNTSKLLERIRRGFSYNAWERFMRNTTLSKDEAMNLVQITSRTLQRRKEEGQLHPDESDRLLRATRIYAETLGLFEGNAEHARRWLTSPQPALGGSTPLDYAATELGAREVEDLIGRLEHGIPL
ncbi:MAG: antitoxin Xre/MbcA/ParS toxin-binding domain-containing protein [Desulfobacterales bacterium]